MASDKFNKISVEWAKSPDTAINTDVLGIEGLSEEQRLFLYQTQDTFRRNKTPESGFGSFDAQYNLAYGGMPSDEDFEMDSPQSQQYYATANSFLQEVKRLKGNEEITFNDEEYGKIAKATLMKSALNRQMASLGTANISDDMRTYLSEGLRSKGIQVTEDTLQQMYRFYMSRSIQE